MLAIYKRDTASYFRTMSGYIFFAVIFVVAGYAFCAENVIGGAGDLTGMFSALAAAMVFTVPFMSARLYFDGREINTEQMLYVSSIKIILAKFFAVMSVASAGVAATWIYAGILSIFGSLHIAELLLYQAGLILLAGAMAALTMFIVSISNRKMQVIVLLTMFVAVMFAANGVLNAADGGIYAKLLGLLGLFYEYSGFGLGILSLPAVVYMLAFMTVFILLACAMTERHRERGL